MTQMYAELRIIDLMPSNENKRTLSYSNSKLSGRIDHLMDN